LLFFASRKSEPSDKDYDARSVRPGAPAGSRHLYEIFTEVEVTNSEPVRFVRPRNGPLPKSMGIAVRITRLSRPSSLDDRRLADAFKLLVDYEPPHLVQTFKPAYD